MRPGNVVRCLSLLGFLLPLGAMAEEAPSVEEIVRKANAAAFYAGTDGRAEVRMTIADSQGRERRRQFTVLRKDVAEGGDQKYLVLFSKPADIRKTVFLVHKQVGKDDNRWLYLPGLDLVKRISAGDNRTSFVGSDYFYEDISGRGIDEDVHELKETTDECFTLSSTPKDPGLVEFSRYEICIDKGDFVPRRIEYFDEQGKVYRRVEALEVKELDGFPTVTRAQVSNLRSGGHTLAEFRRVEYDLGIPDSVFTERSLRNPPLRWFSTRK